MNLVTKISFSFRSAIFLSGCGVYDGTEIIEATSILINARKYGQIDAFSLNQNNFHVINHSNGEV